MLKSVDKVTGEADMERIRIISTRQKEHIHKKLSGRNFQQGADSANAPKLKMSRLAYLAMCLAMA